MENWKIVKLGDLLTESKIESKSPNSDKRIRVKLNIGGVEKRPNTNDKEGATKYFIRKAGQFIYGKQNLHKGAFGIVGEDLDGFESSSDIPAYDVSDTCYPEWIFYFFKQGNFYLKLESLAKGVGSKRINDKQLFKLNIALPPKEDQKRFLESVRNLEVKVSFIKKEFENQKTLLNNLKNTILSDAFNGSLTDKWRNENPKQQDIKDLLNNINKEKTFFNNKKSAFQKQPTEALFKIPKNWIWCRYGDLILHIEAGKSPFCEPQSANVDQWGVIKISAISWGVFLEKENKTLPLNIPPFTDKTIKPGDFILTRANTPELVARSVIVPDNVRDKLLLNDKTLRVKFSNFVDLKFINYFNNSAIARSYYQLVASGTSDSMKNISRENILDQPIPLPPLAEQNAISNKIEQTFINCVKLDVQIEQSKNEVEVLFNSMLARYFQNVSLNPNLLELNKELANIISAPLQDYNVAIKSKILNMELDEILRENGKMSALNLWKMSRFENNIDAFYADLKRLVETEKKIIESSEKGYLEIVS